MADDPVYHNGTHESTLAPQIKWPIKRYQDHATKLFANIVCFLKVVGTVMKNKDGSSLGRYVFGSEISYNKAPPRLPGLGC